MNRTQDAEDSAKYPDYGFSKDLLPKSSSYPLKRSLLNEALDSYQIRKQVFSVYYQYGRFNLNGCKGGYAVDVLAVDYVSELDKCHFSVRGRCRITAYSVPSEERKMCEEIIVREALPKLCAWIEKAANAGNTWRAKRHGIQFKIKDNQLICMQHES